MSVAAMTWAWRQLGLEDDEKLLLLWLADQCDQDGHGNGRLPALDRMPVADPKRALEELGARGFIEVEGEWIRLNFEEAAV